MRQETNDDFGNYADGGALLADCLEGLLPPAEINVSDFTAEHRYLNNAGGGYVGRWSHDVTPYLVEPMDAFTSKIYDCMAVVGPGQSAKTSIAENALLHAVENRPAGWLWYMQSDAAVEAYVKDRIDPMIESHPHLRDNLGLRPVDDSLHYKRFRRMRLQFLAANRSNLISKSSPVIIADEIDAYPESLGDPKQLLDVRRQTFGMASMLGIFSHPDRATDRNPKGWTAGVMLVYADSTQGKWYWPCPHCNGFSSPTPGAEYYMRLAWNKDEQNLDAAAESAHLVCPHCGCLDIFDEHRHGMNQGGDWVHQGQAIDAEGKVTGARIPSRTVGYWITGVMSPFIRDGIKGLVRARVKAQRDEQITGDSTTVKEVMVKQWGWPWGVKAAAFEMPVEVQDLLDRAEDYPLRVVPKGVRFIAAWADVQAHSFDVMVVGFGPWMECWPIDRFQIFKAEGEDRPIDPATRADDWNLLLDKVLQNTYPLQGDPDRVMGVARLGIDSAGKAGVTEKAYAFYSKINKKGLAGRIILTKGASAKDAPRVAERLPDSMRKDRKAKARGEVPVWLFNPNALKDEIDAALRSVKPGPGFLHLPEGLKEATPPHHFFEEITAENRTPDGKWIKEKPRNEALDQAVGTRIVALSAKADRINWNNPAKVPGWARAWDENTLVFAKADKPTVAMGATKRRRRVRSKGI